MRIGIDIDGVITDIEQWQIDYGSKFYYENYKKEIVNYNGYETNEIFDTDIEIDNEFWHEYFESYSTNVEPRKFCSEIFNKLRNAGNEIYIITARGSFLSHSIDVMSYEKNKKIVVDWLEKNKIKYDKIIFSPEDKLELCKENKIELMIEDKVTNIENISTIIPVICFHAGYNEHCKNANIFRCYSWYDVYTKINKIIESKGSE